MMSDKPIAEPGELAERFRNLEPWRSTRRDVLEAARQRAQLNYGQGDDQRPDGSVPGR